MKALASLTTCLVLALIVSATSYASTEAERCTDLVKECFAYSGGERDTCFKAAAEHTFCEDTQAGSMAAQRGEFSLLNPDGKDVGPSFLGTQLIDPACLANFDTAWSGALIKGTPSTETYMTLATELQRCAHAPAADMIRP